MFLDSTVPKQMIWVPKNIYITVGPLRASGLGKCRELQRGGSKQLYVLWARDEKLATDSGKLQRDTVFWVVCC